MTRLHCALNINFTVVALESIDASNTSVVDAYAMEVNDIVLTIESQTYGL
jgi:hypothetical protein